MRKRYTTAVHGEVIRLRDEGKSFRAIAASLGLGHSTIIEGVARRGKGGGSELSLKADVLMHEILGFLGEALYDRPRTVEQLLDALTPQQRRALGTYCERMIVWLENPHVSDAM